MVADLALTALFGAAVLAGFTLHRGFFLVRVTGPSMEPALRAGDRLLVWRVKADRLRPGRVCVVAEDDSTLTVKRAAAGPGDPVPDFLRTPDAGVVPAGRLVLLGDNPARSHDSRSVGYYRADRLRGVVVGVAFSAWRGRLLGWRRLPTTTCASR